MADPQAAPPAHTTPAPEGHDAAMAAKFDQNAATAAAAPAPAGGSAAVPQRPEGIPEKFWDPVKGEVRVADLAKSYAELERQKGQAQSQDGNKQPPADSTQQAKADAAQADAVKAVGQDAFAKYTAEFDAKGALSEDSYKELQAKGFDKSLVDAYVAGQVALRGSAESQVFSTVGGEDKYNEMVAWAGTAFTPTEVDAYDAALTKGGPDMLKAVEGLKARYEATFGSSQAGMLRPNDGHSSATGYTSQAQMIADMKDPRYGSDPAYRASVERKLAVTTAW